MRFAALLLIVWLCLGVPVSAQTFYNPTLVEFTSVDHAMATHYVVEFWLSGAPLTGLPVQKATIPVTAITVGAPGPPITYQLFLKDVPVFLPFGKSYVLRLIVCIDVDCGAPSEVTRETVRYTYCQSGPNSIKPLTIVQPVPPIGTVGAYLAIPLTLDAPKAIHSVSVSLVGSAQPAFYFTGSDLRGSPSVTLGPLPRAGRYLMNIFAADEAGCSATQATQYLTVR